MRSLILLFVAFGTTSATTGFDAMEKLDKTIFTCLQSSNQASFFIGRIWERSGRFDTRGLGNLKAANETGYTTDGLFDVCLSTNCATAASQFESAINRINQEGVPLGTVWIGLQGEHWNQDVASHQKVVQDIAAQADKMKVTVGVQTSQREWDRVMGKDFTGLSTRPLWWEHNDHTPAFGNYTAFGGWTAPTMHRYQNIRPCSTPAFIDLDYKA